MIRFFRIAIAVSTAFAFLFPVRAASSVAGTSSDVSVARVPVNSGVRDIGRAGPDTHVYLAVVLSCRHARELAQFTDGATNLSAVLTSRQFDEYFAPSPSSYARVASILERDGLRIVKTYANRTVIDAAGTAPDVDRIFKTEIHLVRQRDGSVHYANVLPAYVPRELLPDVYGIAGFDDLRSFEPFNVRGDRAKVDTKIGPPLAGPDFGFGPFVTATAYDLPVQHAVPGTWPGRTYDGLGRSAAVVIDANFLDTDLRGFLNYFHVKRIGPPTVRVPINGGPPPGLTADSVEATLDVETIVGNAPGVALYVYGLDSLKNTSVLDAYNQVNSDDAVDVANSSFGGCETQTSPSNFPQLANHLAQQGVALGIVYAAATGDGGAYPCGPFKIGVESPASGPAFVAVGGTTLIPRLNGTYSKEVGWYGSGGGLSAVFPLPSYQNGIPNVRGTMRNLPDVAFDADPGSGVAFYFSGLWQGPLGGTSLASPIFSALTVELAQISRCRLGNVHPALYRAYATYGYDKPPGMTLFHDVVGGNNSSYNATKGFDRVTGIGSMDGWNFGRVTRY